jgi:hypothetical protein
VRFASGAVCWRSMNGQGLLEGKHVVIIGGTWSA